MELPHQHNPIQLVGERDQLFENGPYPKPFEFNHDVVRVFDDMVSRSVPLYEETNRSIAEWAFFHYQQNTNFYDIGCSTGTTIECVSQFLKAGVRFIGIDNSPAMLEKAKEKLKASQNQHKISLVCSDAQSTEISNASFVTMTYTLQFIAVSQRAELLKKIYQGLRPGGILYLSEKVRGECPEFHETQVRLYENFKLKAGYSKTEIEKKKEALDQVLVPLSLKEQIDMLSSVGFDYCEPILKWNNFASIVAIKK